jgi:hypothetical protein
MKPKFLEGLVSALEFAPMQAVMFLKVNLGVDAKYCIMDNSFPPAAKQSNN